MKRKRYRLAHTRSRLAERGFSSPESAGGFPSPVVRAARPCRSPGNWNRTVFRTFPGRSPCSRQTQYRIQADDPVLDLAFGHTIFFERSSNRFVADGFNDLQRKHLAGQ